MVLMIFIKTIFIKGTTSKQENENISYLASIQFRDSSFDFSPGKITP